MKITDEVSLYYMRDNHTFKRLTGPVEDMLAQVMAEFDDGYTYGMLCTESLPGIGYVHAHGTADRQRFQNEAREWLFAAKIRSELP
ncbi:hypothetical protein BMUNKI379_11435 [Burkholderia multivorans]|uniref:Uncharacterized protein n=1 Tax=Burkholderia multivorans CGD2 TaxID=513052 RepID=B9BHP4_9BURK|nr:hypothetical protein [Burkholderia multivorans]EEE09227.1 hypothetical protein BURMUCGD2_4599 [Burkholderia multivorans CGD2]EEE15145.1 hypothetical protein BURMUCGD2M_4587 [Burkholderia multivorans CGD2M]KPJ34705.1 hypothetical protein BMUNKI379_11435 [Burkholderia multivorans]MCA8338307.1 hypothetical protein [Burkholderia multivorans]PRH11045.1 hypothetical protein C6T61_07505 [Burkholderia multivorans]